jgi:hypothetical protein
MFKFGKKLPIKRNIILAHYFSEVPNYFDGCGVLRNNEMNIETKYSSI